MSYKGTEFRCQSFDLIGEAHKGRPYVVENFGGNRCGCPVAENECILEGAGLEAPMPLDSAPTPPTP